MAGASCVPLETVAQGASKYDCNGPKEDAGQACCSLKCPADQPDCIRIAQADACPEHAPAPNSACPRDFPPSKQCVYNLVCAGTSDGKARRRASMAPDFKGCMFTTFANCDSDGGVWMIAEASAGGAGGGSEIGGGDGGGGYAQGEAEGDASLDASVIVRAGGTISVHAGGSLHIGGRSE